MSEQRPNDLVLDQAQRYLRRLERMKVGYAELKNRAPDLYEHCAASASAIAYNHQIGLKGATEIEAALVSMALKALDYV